MSLTPSPADRIWLHTLKEVRREKCRRRVRRATVLTAVPLALLTTWWALHPGGKAGTPLVLQQVDSRAVASYDPPRSFESWTAAELGLREQTVAGGLFYAGYLPRPPGQALIPAFLLPEEAPRASGRNPATQSSATAGCVARLLVLPGESSCLVSM